MLARSASINPRIVVGYPRMSYIAGCSFSMAGTGLWPKHWTCCVDTLCEVRFALYLIKYLIETCLRRITPSHIRRYSAIERPIRSMSRCDRRLLRTRPWLTSGQRLSRNQKWYHRSIFKSTPKKEYSLNPACACPPHNRSLQHSNVKSSSLMSGRVADFALQ